MAWRKNVSDVFTPRRHDVNKKMYVERPRLEKELIRAIKGSQHVLLYGESGNGKSWLYRKVLGEGTKYVAANCANADRFSSLTAEIQSAAYSEEEAVKVGYSESKSVGLNIFAAEGQLSHQGNFEYRRNEPLLAAFKKLSDNSRGELTVLVLENLESIYDDSSRMDELANILLLLDDPRYAELRIKFLIVGTPSGVLEYFSKTKNLDSVANRIVELGKVDGFNIKEVTELITKGFVDELKISISDDEIFELATRIFHVTMGVAQRVHEYCEKLAYEIEDNEWHYDFELTRAAENQWLTTGLRQSYSIVEANLNSRDTAVSRRNQVMYSIGRIKTHQFDSRDIEKIIEKDFPETVPETNMGLGSILTDLSNGDDALLVRSQKTGQYRVRDPRYTMCVRVVLYKDRVTGKVAKRKFKNG